jgi:hypothetical protein
VSDPEGYASAKAVEMAIAAGAKAIHDTDPTRNVNDLIRQAHYDRFLCRVFYEGPDSEWVLKGGSGMLARVPNARRTLDADLHRHGYSKDQALSELKGVALIDLGDFFRFVYRKHDVILDDDIQPYADGYRVVFDAYLGTRAIDPIKVDLSVHVGATDSFTIEDPANRVPLPRLRAVPYRLYPVVNQVADKVCATIADYSGRPSSREKDLVDLVVIAVTQSVEATALHDAIVNECRLRHLPFPTEFTIPKDWGARYAKLAFNTPAAPYDTTAARDLMARFVGRVLSEQPQGTWEPDLRRWQE